MPPKRRKASATTGKQVVAKKSTSVPPKLNNASARRRETQSAKQSAVAAATKPQRRQAQQQQQQQQRSSRKRDRKADADSKQNNSSSSSTSSSISSTNDDDSTDSSDSSLILSTSPSTLSPALQPSSSLPENATTVVLQTLAELARRAEHKALLVHGAAAVTGGSPDVSGHHQSNINNNNHHHIESNSSYARRSADSGLSSHGTASPRKLELDISSSPSSSVGAAAGSRLSEEKIDGHPRATAVDETRHHSQPKQQPVNGQDGAPAKIAVYGSLTTGSETGRSGTGHREHSVASPHGRKQSNTNSTCSSDDDDDGDTLLAVTLSTLGMTQEGMKEDSPEALTANSEGRKSSSSWQQQQPQQQQLTSSGDRATVEGAAARTPSSPGGEAEVLGERKDRDKAKADGVVKELFDMARKSISCESMFIDEENLGDATPPTANVVAAAINSTPLRPPSSATRHGDGDCEAGEVQQVEGGHQTAERRLHHRKVSSNISSSGSSGGNTYNHAKMKSSALQHEDGDQPPPVPASADTPPPSLVFQAREKQQQQQQQQQTGASSQNAAPSSSIAGLTHKPGGRPATHHVRQSGDIIEADSGEYIRQQQMTTTGHLQLGNTSRGRSPALMSKHTSIDPVRDGHTLPPGTTAHHGEAGEGLRTPPRSTVKEPNLWNSPQSLCTPAYTGRVSLTPGGSGGTAPSYHHVPSSAPAGGGGSRLSTQLVTRAAAARPTASPGTLWIRLDDDDEDEQEPTSPSSPTLCNVRISLQSANVAATSKSEAISQLSPEDVPHSGGFHHPHNHNNRSVATSMFNWATSSARETSPFSHAMSSTGSAIQSVVLSSPQPQIPGNNRYSQQQEHGELATLSMGRGTAISDVLSPTFRPRRRPVARDASGRSIYIRMDDDDDDEEEEGEMERQSQLERSQGKMGDVIKAVAAATAAGGGASSLFINRADVTHKLTRNSHNRCVSRSPRGAIRSDTGERNCDAPPTLEGASTARPSRASSHPYILDDDDSDSDEDEAQAISAEAKKKEEEGHAGSLSPGTILKARKVTKRMFPSRNRGEEGTVPAAEEQQPEEEEEEAHKKGKKRTQRKATRKPKATRKHHAVVVSAHGKRGGEEEEEEGGGKAKLRPVDIALQGLYPERFTRKTFTEATKRVLSEDHVLDEGDFWAAFESAEFVGEGSFGLVWRCRTIDGDLVAVKSCPISLASRANIEDSFSTLREVATMRFMGQMQIPYVLPLHSAFYTPETEVLPPLAMEALQWRRALKKKAEAVVLERQVQLLSYGKGATNSSGGGGGAAAAAAKRARNGAKPQKNVTTISNDKKGEHEQVLTFDQQVQAQLEVLRTSGEETAEEAAERERLGRVKLPRFLSISEEDVLQCDATIFLVMELCDGDLEGIRRNDAVAKGAAYCVSSALAAMHELGLLHLDLKPSNILFAFEHGPSQQTTFSTFAQDIPRMVLEPSSAAAITTGATGTSATESVKFYLSDFGNCRIVGPDPLDYVTDAYGTYEYMDLRALRDAECSRATDCYSLGASLYEMLFSKRLYPRCQNPKCEGDEDHTRECFVEAATRPTWLPVAEGKGVLVTSGPASSSSASTTTAATGNGKIPLTTLQKITAALLKKDWSERMTAAQCRAHLIRKYNITQMGSGSPLEE